MVWCDPLVSTYVLLVREKDVFHLALGSSKTTQVVFHHQLCQRKKCLRLPSYNNRQICIRHKVLPILRIRLDYLRLLGL